MLFSSRVQISMNRVGAISTRMMKHLNDSIRIEGLIMFCGVATSFLRTVSKPPQRRSTTCLSSKKNLPMLVRKLLMETRPNSLSSGMEAGNQAGRW